MRKHTDVLSDLARSSDHASDDAPRSDDVYPARMSSNDGDRAGMHHADDDVHSELSDREEGDEGGQDAAGGELAPHRNARRALDQLPQLAGHLATWYYQVGMSRSNMEDLLRILKRDGVNTGFTKVARMNALIDAADVPANDRHEVMRTVDVELGQRTYQVRAHFPSYA